MQLLNNTGKQPVLPAKRIISLVPSLTELLADIGLEEQTVGITKFCVRPEQWFQSKRRVGGTKNVQLDTLKALRPDLVIASKEENIKEQIEEISSFCPVLVTDVIDLETALDAISAIGFFCGRQKEAAIMGQDISRAFNELSFSSARSAVYLIWREPWMAAGGDTFINDMLLFAGFKNVLHNRFRYPELALPEIAALHPENILLSNEPYPFKEHHLEEIATHIPGATIKLVDGEMFSWYGSRLLQAPAYFKGLNS